MERKHHAFGLVATGYLGFGDQLAAQQMATSVRNHEVRLATGKWLTVDLHYHFGKSPNRGGKGALWRRDNLDRHFTGEDFFPKHA